MEDFINNETQPNSENFSGIYPPKPVLKTEKDKNHAIKSLINLLIYGVLFYMLFTPNIAYIATILIVIIIHELGHFALMRFFDYKNVKIFFIPLIGGYASGTKQQVSQFQLSLIILAGPVPGIIIGTILYFVNKNYNNETISMMANCFLAINILNCLPFHPLDGGRLLETLFIKDNFVVRLVFGAISILCLVALLILNNSYFMLVIPVFIGIELYREIKHNKIRTYLEQEKINYRVDYDNLSDKDYWLIRDCLLFSFPKKYGNIPPGQYQYSFAEPLLMQHISAILQLHYLYDLNLIKRIAFLLFYLSLLFVPLWYIISHWK